MDQDVSARTRRYQANIQAELDRAAVYRTMAEVERDDRLADNFRRLADTEESHVEFWRERIGELDASAPAQRPSARARLLGRLARMFGSRLVLPAAASLEQAEQETYEHQPEADGTDIGADERLHGRVLDAAIEASTTGVTANGCRCRARASSISDSSISRPRRSPPTPPTSVQNSSRSMRGEA